jgi:hypothetical protein
LRAFAAKNSHTVENDREKLLRFLRGVSFRAKQSESDWRGSRRFTFRAILVARSSRLFHFLRNAFLEVFGALELGF